MMKRKILFLFLFLGIKLQLVLLEMLHRPLTQTERREEDHKLQLEINRIIPSLHLMREMIKLDKITEMCRQEELQIPMTFGASMNNKLKMKLGFKNFAEIQHI